MASAQSTKAMWLGGLGLGVLGVLLAARWGDGGGMSEDVAPPTSPAEEWVTRVILRVSQHEGGFDALNRNADGAGLSFGMLQWAQKPGSLGELLHQMYRADPKRFQATFGPAAADLLRVTGVPSLAPVDGAVLWKEPWLGRFKAAGRDPIFQRVQMAMAREGAYFRGAMEAAHRLGIMTERSVALMMDTAVQQGPGFAKKLAGRVRDLYAGKVIPMTVVLETYARLAPAHFLRMEPPTEAYPVSHLRWVKVGAREWHVFAGGFDLYADILRRRMGIVGDGGLGDGPVAELRPDVESSSSTPSQQV